MDINYQLRFYQDAIKYSNQIFDQIISRIYSHTLKDGDNVIEVGANTGLHTIPIANRIAPSGKIMAFEPVAETMKKLKRKVKDNQLENNIITHEIALSNRVGTSDFYVVRNRPGLSCIHLSPSYNLAELDLEKREIQTEILDNMVSDDFNFKFLKIDAEGADFSILQGGEKTIALNRPVIIFEGWGVKAGVARLYHYSKEDFFDYFIKINYNLYDLLGLPFHQELWEARTLNDLIAFPNENKKELLELVWISVLETFGKNLLEVKKDIETPHEL